MKIIADEDIPYDFVAELDEFDITTVVRAGYGGLKNGALLRTLTGNFDVLITADKNLKHQQNLKRWKIAVIAMPTNNVVEILGFLPETKEALRNLKPGNYVQIGW